MKDAWQLLSSPQLSPTQMMSVTVLRDEGSNVNVFDIELCKSFKKVLN